MSYVAAAESLAPLYGHVPPLLAPMHAYAPVGVLDLYGAVRLSMAINWVASDTKGKPRAPALQEVLGVLIVVFGGETFLALCTGTPPSWLVNPTFVVLFGLTHLLLTRSPLSKLMPTKPNFLMELALAPFDAVGRTLLLTRFSVVPLLHPPHGAAVLPATPSTLLLVPFILAVPFSALVFTGANFFGSQLELQTPAELKPWGWTALDAWIPLVLPSLFLCLIGPVKGWPIGFGTHLSEDAAIVICCAFTIVCFVSRVIYNLGPAAKDDNNGPRAVPKRNKHKKVKKV